MVSVPLIVTYSAGGGYQWTAPPGVTSVTAVVWGAGGGGGSASATSGSNGGGGGGGEVACESAVAVTPGSSYTVTVGAGGPGGAAGSDGAAGGFSAFTGDSLAVIAPGGGAGTAGVGGAGQGGNGGTGSTNTVTADGGAGEDGTAATNGGGGGGAGGTDTAVGYPGNSASGSTAGGASLGTYQGGAGGAGASSSGAGSNGSGPGGGGGGALNTGSTQHGGGNGADGQVIITWTQSDPITLTNASPGATVQFTAPLGATAVKAECWGGGAGGYNAQSGTALCGSTTLTAGYGGGTRQQAAATLDQYVGRPLGLAAQVVYLHEGEIQTGPNTPQQVGTLTGMGCKVYVCFKPSRLAHAQGGAALTAERANLASSCSTINAISGVNWTGVVWQEQSLGGKGSNFGDGTQTPNAPAPPNTPNFPASNAQVKNTTGIDPVYVSITGGSISNITISGVSQTLSYGIYALPNNGTITITYTGSPSWQWWLTPYGGPGQLTEAQAAANYISYHHAYAPTVHSAGVQVSYKPALAYNQPSLDMFPGTGNTGCDLVSPDWYTTDLVKKTNSATVFGASNIEGVADAAGVPLGLGEFGLANGVNTPTQAQWNTFVTAILNGFQARISAGKPVADVMFYTGQNAGGANNVTGPTDFKVSGLQQIFDLFSTATTSVGGAGGGGGEYAAESSLAVTPSGLAKYTVVVGAGGGGRTSGGNTTVAGDSVTVTGHGGSVATTQSAGGTGGTGSANSTHHDGGHGGAGGVSNGGGGGGGSSGGTSAGGGSGFPGSGSAGGPGGLAPAGGGPGGLGGGPNGDGSPPLSGPGGGGGARGANGLSNGAGSDGQVTLSNFVTQTACAGAFTLAPLTLAASGGGGGGARFVLGTPTLAGTATVGGFALVQNGTAASVASGNITFTLPGNSTAGTLLIVQLVVNSLTTTTGPGAPWVRIASQAVGNSGAAHAETWMYNPSGDAKTGGNPGGISSAGAFNAGSNGIRGHMLEFKTLAPGTVAVLNGTIATATGGPTVSSFPTTCGSGTSAGDLGLYLVNDNFSTAVSLTWNTPTPAGWVQATAQANTIANTWQSSYNLGLNAGAQTVTSSISSSTSEVGWAGVFSVFTPAGLVTGTGSLALAPLAFAASGTSGVPTGTVVSNGGLQLAPLALQSPSQAVTFPAQPLPIMVEILVNGTWTDISASVYARDGITISGRGRPNEASTAQPTQVTVTLNNRDGSFSPQNTSGPFYPYLTRNTQIRISVVNAVTTQGANYNGNNVNADGYRFWGEVPAWPVAWDVSGSDVYVPVSACGVLQRMQQSKFSASPIARYYTNQYNTASRFQFLTGPLAPAGYWTCEDGSNAGSFASGIPGGSPMTFTGKPNLSQDSSIPGSAPFAQLAGSVWTGTPGQFTSGGVTFSTPGTYQWTCPGGVTSVQAECWGGGGGGASGTTATAGGGGEYAAEAAVAVTPGVQYTLVVGAGGSGGAGAFVGQGNPGVTGAASTFSGDSVTVTGHGGKRGSLTGGGAGGTGSSNTTHHFGGAGGGARTGYGGSGGGGSGGTVAVGNAGNAATSDVGGAGAFAVTGGGPGGAGGHGGNVHLPGVTPFPGPGGGGGGGGLNPANSFGLRGGNGAAGQVRLTFGTSSTPPANVLRFVLDVPASGGVNAACYGQITTTGTVATLSVIYHTGGNLELTGKDATGLQLFTSGSQAFGCNGQPMLVSAELTPGGSGVKWKLTALTPGASAVVATFKGTVGGVLGAVTQVNVNNAAATETGAVGVGHVAVQYSVDPILNLSQTLNAHIGETAATRFLRLCNEQFVPAVLTGNQADTPQMGAQPTDLLVNLLQDCENADLGQMFELRDAFGLGYRTRVSLQNQAAAVTLDYSLAQLVPPLTPTNDDALTRNDIIATRAGGGTFYETSLTSGPMSVLDPPNGVGLYSYSVTVNVMSDSQLAAFAAWLLILGTLDEFRYPVITTNLVRASVADGTFSDLASLDIGDLLTILNPPSWLPPYNINQLAFGFTETLNAYEWTIAINAVPADPYTPGNSGNTTTLPTW